MRGRYGVGRTYTGSGFLPPLLPVPPLLPLVLPLSLVVPAGLAGGGELVVVVVGVVNCTGPGAEIDVVFCVLLPLLVPLPLVLVSPSFGVPLWVVGCVGLCVVCEVGCDGDAGCDGESLFVPWVVVGVDEAGGGSLCVVGAAAGADAGAGAAGAGAAGASAGVAEAAGAAADVVAGGTYDFGSARLGDAWPITTSPARATTVLR